MSSICSPILTGYWQMGNADILAAVEHLRYRRPHDAPVAGALGSGKIMWDDHHFATT